MTDAREVADDESSEGDEDADDERDGVTDHLAEVPVGAGCTEIWDHLSEQRRKDDA